MLVLLYAVSRDGAARFLMLALMAMTLTNPVLALFPISKPAQVEVSELPQP